MNRILAAVEKLKAGNTPEQIREAATIATLAPGEGPVYQDLQARAHAAGILTMDEAQTIYHALGGEGAHWTEDTEPALRVVVTKTLAELAPLAVAGRI